MHRSRFHYRARTVTLEQADRMAIARFPGSAVAMACSFFSPRGPPGAAEGTRR